MKRKIYICMSILMAFLLSLNIVHAQEASNIPSYELSTIEKDMLEAYKSGKTQDPSFIQMRKEKATKFGLLDYCDENYFLTDVFYKKYSDNYLIHDGLIILDRYVAGYQNISPNIALYSSNTVMNVEHHRFEDGQGHYIANGIWLLSNSIYAFCAEGLNSSPAAGDALSDAYEINNVNLRKCLYYGYKGPQDILSSRYGKSGAIVLTDELVSNAYSGTCIGKEANDGFHWNNTVSALWNEITSKPDPTSFKAYMVDVAGTGYNWQGVLKPNQKLVYGVYQPMGSLQIQKKSKLNIISDNNASYTFKGAIYGLYKDAECKEKVDEFVVQENGYSNVISNLSIQTYYVQEIKAPHGYQKDTTVYKANIKENQMVVISVSDVPQTNIVDLVLQKKDAQTGNKAQGMASLANAQYVFKFYGGLYDEDPALKKIQPLRTWTLKTDKTGNIQMNDTFKVSGDDFYKDGDGNIVLPLGTITVKESLPPQGYQLDFNVYVQKLDTNSSASAHFTSFNTFSVSDNVIRLKVVKVQEGTDIPLPNVTFKHTMATLPFPKQEKTNEKGEFELVGLTKGLHTLQEFKTLDGYVLNETPIQFEVLSDGSISKNEWIVNNTLRIENQVKPYTLRIVKKNSVNELLDGAIFGLYSDSECKELIEQQTSVNGIVRFENLLNKQKYYVKEIKAPAGYQKDKTIYECFTDFIPALNQYDVYINQEKKNVYQDGFVSLDLINEKMTKLPHTGSNQTLVLMGLGMLMVLIMLQREKK